MAGIRNHILKLYFNLLILGGVCAFPRRKGNGVWDWRGAYVSARTDTTLQERTSPHLGRKAQTVLHPSVSGKQIPERIVALSSEAKSGGGGGQTEPPGGRRRSRRWWDSALGCRLPAGHGHRARVQVLSKHYHRLHLHPGAVQAADKISRKVRDASMQS